MRDENDDGSFGRRLLDWRGVGGPKTGVGQDNPQREFHERRATPAQAAFGPAERCELGQLAVRGVGGPKPGLPMTHAVDEQGIKRGLLTFGRVHFSEAARTDRSSDCH